MSDFYDMALSAIEDVPNRDKPVVLPALLTEVMNLNPRVRENTSAKLMPRSWLSGLTWPRVTTSYPDKER